MIDYTLKNYDKLFTAVLEHLQIVGITLVISVLCSFVLLLIVNRVRWLGRLLYGTLLLTYCIPSIALFALLIPVFGLGKDNVIFGMVLYNLLLLLRNMNAAQNAIPLEIKDAAAGLGLDSIQIMKMVYIPIMLPYFIAGLRVATVSTTGIATMASLVNAGGLGTILFEGMRMNHMPKLIWGIILVAGLALILNYIFAKLENRAVSWSSGGKITGKEKISMS